jgi:YesN/AraC family two-component response regulator
VDLILMDASMPGMNGGEAFDAIRALSPSARALLCSGFSEVPGCEEAFKHGFLDFLKKPFTVKTLQEALEKALAD